MPETELDVADFYRRTADSIREYHNTRFRPPFALTVHPDFWKALVNRLDDSDVRLTASKSPPSYGPITPECVGLMHGIQVLVDPDVAFGEYKLH